MIHEFKAYIVLIIDIQADAIFGVIVILDISSIILTGFAIQLKVKVTF